MSPGHNDCIIQAQALVTLTSASYSVFYLSYLENMVYSMIAVGLLVATSLAVVLHQMLAMVGCFGNFSCTTAFSKIKTVIVAK